MTFRRLRVRSRNSLCHRGGIKLGVIMAWRSKCASHQASLGSVLWPLRALTSYGFARATFTTSSNTLKMGFQYAPVLSIMAWGTCLLLDPFPQLPELTDGSAKLADFGPRFPIGRSSHHTSHQALLTHVDADTTLNDGVNHCDSFLSRE